MTNKPFILSLVSLLFFSFQLNAIDADRLDLRKKISQAASDTIRANLLTQLGRSYKSSQPDSALVFLNQSAELAHFGRAPHLEARARLNIGQVFTEQAKYEEATLQIQRAIALYQQAEDVVGVGKCWNSIGVIRYYQSDFPGASRAYTSALDHFSDPFFIATTYNNIALVEKMAGNAQGFIENQHKALQRFEEMGNQDRALSCLGNLAIFYLEHGDLEKAMEYNQKGYELVENSPSSEQKIFLDLQKAEIIEKQGDLEGALEILRSIRAISAGNEYLRGEASAWEGMGRILLHRKEFELARPRLRKSLLLFQQLEDQRGQALSLANLGWLQVQTEQADSGIHNLQTALGISLKLGEPTTLALIYDQLTEAYALLGENQLALHYRNRYTEIKRELLDPEAWRKVLEVESDFQQSKQEEIIARLQAAEDAAQNQTQILWIGLLLSILVMLIASGYWMRKQKGRVEKRNAEASGRILELRALVDKKNILIDQLKESQAEKRTSQKRPAFWESLTQREIEVFLCLGAGLSDKEIAGELFISLTTVRSHARNIYSKLNLNKRSQVVKMAHEFDLLKAE